MTTDLTYHLSALNTLLHGRSGAAEVRESGGIVTAYISKDVVWGSALLAAIAGAIGAQRALHAGTFGLLVEIGSGSVKLLGRAGGANLLDLKLEVPRDPDGFADAVTRLADTACGGLRRIAPSLFDLKVPERMFDGVAASEDFAFVYATHGLRVLSRQGLDLPGVRVLSGDEEALLAFDAIVPETIRRPGVVAVEIGSGSTEIVRVASDGERLPLTIEVGSRSAQIPGAQITEALLSGEAKALDGLVGSPPEGVKRFLARGVPAMELFINPSGASAGFRAFADGRIDAAMVEAFAAAHPDDAFAVKARILLAVARGLGLDRFRAGRSGGLKSAVAELIERGRAVRFESEVRG